MPSSTSIRPRKGQRWRRRSDGREVEVKMRRTGNPMAPVRPHSDMRWSLVAWTAGSGGGVTHESDFVAEHDYLGVA